MVRSMIVAVIAACSGAFASRLDVQSVSGVSNILITWRESDIMTRWLSCGIRAFSNRSFSRSCCRSYWVCRAVAIAKLIACNLISVGEGLPMTGIEVTCDRPTIAIPAAPDVVQ